ncbi:MAG: NADP-dependent oxidoreductase, partial [Acidobacteriota bacterium]
MSDNLQIRLAARPEGLPKASDFDATHDPKPEPGDGEVLVRLIYLSLDPAMRGWMTDRKSYIEPIGLGDVMRGLVLGEVTESNAEGFAAGDLVSGALGWRQWAVAKPKELQKLPKGMPLPLFLGPLGMTGLTAYFGLLDIGAPKAGETVVVSAAAGAVGSVVGQIAKIVGCRTVGIAGGPEKCRQLTEEFGFDAAVDYKNDDVMKALKKACPDGI